MVKLSFFARTLIVGLLPIGLMLLVFMGFFLPLMLCNFMDYSDGNASRTNRLVLKVKFWKLAFFTIFLLYPHVCSSIINVYNCVNVSGTSYLVDDFNIKCTDKEWVTFATANIVFVLLYPVGIPVYYFFRLRAYQRQGKLSDVAVISQMGFLYASFCDPCWYWELMDMLFKLTMTSLVPFLPNDLEMPGALGCVGVYIVLMLLMQPYIRKGDDRLHLLSLTELFLVIMMALTMESMGSLDFVMDLMVSIVLIGMTIMVVLITILMSVRNLLKVFRSFKLRRQQGQQKPARPLPLAASRSTLKQSSQL